MRYILLSIFIVLSFNGCEDKEAQAKHDAQVAQEARAQLLAELEAKKLQKEKETHKLNKMGINMNDGRIIIDTNKTKAFFNDLGKKMDMRMKKISSDMEKGIVEYKEGGVDINEQHIHIDLNKTRDLLLDWGKQLEVFAKEFDKMTKPLEINSTNTTIKGN